MVVIIGMVGIFRKCFECGCYFKVGGSNTRKTSRHRRCSACQQGVAPVGRIGSTSRGYVITDEGRRALREAGL